MLVSVKPGAIFLVVRVGKRIGRLLFATLPHPGIHKFTL